MAGVRDFDNDELLDLDEIERLDKEYAARDKEYEEADKRRMAEENEQLKDENARLEKTTERLRAEVSQLAAEVQRYRDEANKRREEEERKKYIETGAQDDMKSLKMLIPKILQLQQKKDITPGEKMELGITGAIVKRIISQAKKYNNTAIILEYTGKITDAEIDAVITRGEKEAAAVSAKDQAKLKLFSNQQESKEQGSGTQFRPVAS